MASFKPFLNCINCRPACSDQLPSSKLEALLFYYLSWEVMYLPLGMTEIHHLFFLCFFSLLPPWVSDMPGICVQDACQKDCLLFSHSISLPIFHCQLDGISIKVALKSHGELIAVCLLSGLPGWGEKNS